MRITLPFGAAFVAFWMPTFSAALSAEEALLKDGHRISGELALAAAGRLHFTPKATNKPLSWDTIERIECDSGLPFLAVQIGVRRVILPGDQALTAEFLDWDKEGLRIRALDADTRTLPAAFVRGVCNVPGIVPILEADFDGELSAWRLEGKPEIAAADKTQRTHGLDLNVTGQSATYRLAESLRSGKVGVDFALGEPTAKGRWAIKLNLQAEHGSSTVECDIRGDGLRYQVKVTPTEEEKPSRVCKAGRHRVVVEWGKRNAVVFLDDTVLWKGDAETVRGPLMTIRLACLEAEQKTSLSFVVENVLVAKEVRDSPDPPPPSDQDVVLLPSGDQLFGRITTANRRTIELESRGRRHKLSWGEVVGFCPRPDTFPPRTLEGEWVRLWLRTGTEGVWDDLEGVVAKLDDNKVVLRHPLLGDLPIERSRCHRLRRLFYGQRLELDNGSHHLGEKDRIVPDLQPARAEGPSLSKSFRLESVPSKARFVVSVVHLKGTGDGIGPALDRGDLRTEVWVNNERVDYLNRLVDRDQPWPQRLSVVIPKKLLRVGDNVLELRQTPEAGTNHFEKCGVAELLIETER
ncbi:MAG TPA: hypothetical protein VGG61_10575 [Gemmataceae bacterium]|jgi:hypothetical protein